MAEVVCCHGEGGKPHAWTRPGCPVKPTPEPAVTTDADPADTPMTMLLGVIGGAQQVMAKGGRYRR